ncbi:hypothetical protein OG874_22530 [Nocardia sp. NBC_00565]|uniref:hypothetical protein n=1 Tax=Nocardia sp. NBC_00565 TaxID=2975993 RepID=UPI002E821EC2|nr:hypothetical protein [Nocardia sp. NBC_00565]WUC07694.1 hypothetical protein OG874_22530 [Nocardia sp. NBC_00565]
MAGEPGGLTVDHPLARALVAHGPVGWQRVDAVFAITVTDEVAHIEYSIGGQSFPVDPPEVVLDLVREQRVLAAASDAGPWWRMLVTLASTGEIEVDYDYGANPFPDGQLFIPEAYRADLQAYPREKVPVWLAAYIAHDDRQRRTPQHAAAQARTDREGQVWAVLAENEFPPFPVLWARWATIAAAFVAAQSDRGPRMLPWIGIFESSARDGATLHALPAGRAVLSGGVWDSPILDAVYNRGAPIPELYAGAPDWVTDLVLNPRVGSGLLSFCYWWESGHWYRAQSPSAQDCAAAVPGMWTADTVIGILVDLLGSPDTRDAVAALVSAAESGMVTRETLTAVFGDDGRFDIDSALYQYSLAGLTSTMPQPMPQQQAIIRVRDYITGRGLDTTGYPLSELVAHRLSVGWVVYVPVPEGDIAIGRAIFYLADDGVLEQSSSSVAPMTYIAEFEQRFAQRHGSTA